MKDASARPILEAPVSVPLKDEKILSETEVLDPSYIFTTQWHLRFKTTLSAPVMQTHVHAAYLSRKAGSVTVLPIIARFCQLAVVKCICSFVYIAQSIRLRNDPSPISY